MKMVMFLITISFLWHDVLCSEALLENKESISVAHKTVVDELINIRKNNPGSQSKVYAILDKLELLNGAMQRRFDEENQLRETLKQKDEEIATLKKAMTDLKAEEVAMHKELALAQQSLEDAQKMQDSKDKEKAQLEQQLNSVQDVVKQQSVQLAHVEEQALSKEVAQIESAENKK